MAYQNKKRARFHSLPFISSVGTGWSTSSVLIGVVSHVNLVGARAFIDALLECFDNDPLSKCGFKVLFGGVFGIPPTDSRIGFWGTSTKGLQRSKAAKAHCKDNGFRSGGQRSYGNSCIEQGISDAKSLFTALVLALRKSPIGGFEHPAAKSAGAKAISMMVNSLRLLRAR